MQANPLASECEMLASLSERGKLGSMIDRLAVCQMPWLRVHADEEDLGARDYLRSVRGDEVIHGRHPGVRNALSLIRMAPSTL
jgi:hypothetical protein